MAACFLCFFPLINEYFPTGHFVVDLCGGFQIIRHGVFWIIRIVDQGESFRHGDRDDAIGIFPEDAAQDAGIVDLRTCFPQDTGTGRRVGGRRSVSVCDIREVQ